MHEGGKPLKAGDQPTKKEILSGGGHHGHAKATDRDEAMPKGSDESRWNKVLKESGCFRVIFEDSREGRVIVDEKTLRFSACNRMMCEMLGYTAKEVLSLCVRDIHPVESLPAVLKQFEGLVKRDINVAKDVPVKRKDGSVFYVDASVAVCVAEGKTYVAGSFRDVTERKIMDGELRDKVVELERFNRLMVGRELKMIELKSEVDSLLVRLKEKPRYSV
jgi:PAS domain S-box-containing protein